jgi:hypothetical protein
MTTSPEKHGPVGLQQQCGVLPSRDGDGEVSRQRRTGLDPVAILDRGGRRMMALGSGDCGQPCGPRGGPRSGRGGRAESARARVRPRPNREPRQKLSIGAPLRLSGACGPYGEDDVGADGRLHGQRPSVLLAGWRLAIPASRSWPLPRPGSDGGCRSGSAGGPGALTAGDRGLDAGPGSDALRGNAGGNVGVRPSREVDRGRHDVCGFAAIPVPDCRPSPPIAGSG